MAGDTSRFLISLSIPFISFVFWFLKRRALKSAVSKAVQVEDPLASETGKFFELDPMKLITSDNYEGNCDNSTMLLKDNPASPTPDTSDVAQQNGSTSDEEKGKCKLREKAHTCSADFFSNGSPQDNGAELAVAFENVDLDSNGSAEDELLNAINTSSGEMNNDTNISQSNGQIANGEAESATESTPGQENGECGTESDNTVCINSDKVDACNRTDSHESLLPADCVDAQGDPSSTAATYCDSVISNDSGRGGSEIHFEPASLYPESNVLNYAFEISQEYVGRLIGKSGSTVRSIKNQTNADVFVKRHPSSSHSKICMLTGTEVEINSALRLIRRKFPIEKFPTVTLSQICFLPFMPCPENLMLRLPESTSVDVFLASVVSAGHFFVHQPTHPSYYSINDLSFSLTHFYNNDMNAPALPHMERGYICAVNVNDNWFRAGIDEVFPDGNRCRVKFLDCGGYSEVSRSALRQINYQFMIMPFQAIECYLAHVCPLEGETGWSQEATDCFENLCKGQYLHCFIVAYAENGIPLVQLYSTTGAAMMDINRELVNSGFVRSIEPQPEIVSQNP